MILIILILPMGVMGIMGIMKNQKLSEKVLTMATEITMPKLSDTMTDGRFIGWRKSVGERVERGEVIAEVETDKAVMELEAFASGVLLKIMATGGETVPVGTVLGLIGEAGEAASEAPVPPAAPAQEASAPPAPTPPAAEIPAPETAETIQVDEGHEKASPLVRRMAREQAIDLAQVHGSGPEGRVLQEDLAAFASAHGPLPTPPTSSGVVPEPATAAVADVPPASVASAMRQAIGATVARSWREIPHFTVTVEIGMQACREIVHELKGGETAVGYNDMVIKACAVALLRFSGLNAHAGDAAAEAGVHIGFAVALPDGLLVPVIRHCERLSPPEIARETSRLAERARSGRLTQAEMSAGGFTVSNLGMYGVDEFMALIMPGQVAILAVGAVSERPAVLEGGLVIAPTMRVTLSADHRIVDGAYAAAFLAELRHILEKPLPMFM